MMFSLQTNSRRLPQILSGAQGSWVGDPASVTWELRNLMPAKIMQLTLQKMAAYALPSASSTVATSGMTVSTFMILNSSITRLLTPATTSRTPRFWQWT